MSLLYRGEMGRKKEAHQALLHVFYRSFFSGQSHFRDEKN